MRSIVFSFIILGSVFAASMARPGNPEVIRLKSTIALPGVVGRIDHMTVDRRSDRLFVVALGNNTVEVVDMKLGNRIKSLPGFNEPQGVLYVEKSNRLYVANGGNGNLDVIDGSSYKRITSIPVGDDADNVRLDTSSGIIFVAFGEGGLAAIDPGLNNVQYTIVLPAHPEAFVIEPGGSRIFVNVPGKEKVFVVDKGKRAIIDSWAIGEASSNFPMAYEPAKNRLFVGCRNPAAIVMLEAKSGKLLNTLMIGGDVDDVFFDAKRRRLLASCGEGLVSILSENPAGTFSIEATVATRRGGRTALLIPDQDKYVVAVPKNGNADAEIRLFSLAGD
ncbi:MAG TPA: YncE family protein [Bacteroidota bacterium]